MTHATLALPSTVTAPELALIPLLPLAAFTVLILIGRRLGRFSAWLAVAALAGAAGVSLGVGPAVKAGQRLGISWPGLAAGDPRWTLGLAVDGLTWLMLLVVTLIGTLIAVYSVGYMRGDPRFSRFFAYLALFCASMLTLVLADHLVLLYAGWELVGLCSYLLISFWFEKPAAAEAGRKAFLTTRIGDTGLLMGILTLVWVGAPLHVDALARAGLAPGLLTAVSLLIFLGAVGKSAQVPLHVWLPDAMEGPTPVSALIHAATMVAAGVYLVARMLPIFTPTSLAVVLGIGLTTHLFAGTVALTQTDIKRILAYSTISQLGLMFTALGLGAGALGMFHLTTHACFKALLFLAAGSVIHATHEQELERLGGLRRAIPWTAGLFLLAALAMSGMFPLSGFWSKDAVLVEAAHARPWLFWMLLAGAAMTAGYIVRLYLRCFEGPSPARSHGGHPPHESPLVMVLPMAVLGVAAAVVGLTGSIWWQPFFHLLGVHGHTALDLPVLLWSTGAALAGAALAWLVGVRHRLRLPAALQPLGHRLYALAFNKYYVDEAYGAAVIRTTLDAAEEFSRFDRAVIDGAVDGAGAAGDLVSRWKERFDRLVVDGLVNGVATAARAAGAGLRRIQTGVVQQYLLIAVASVVLLAAWLVR